MEPAVLKTSGTFSRWSRSNPDSRLICSTTVTDTDAVLADSLRPCNGMAPCYSTLEIVRFVVVVVIKVLIEI